MTSPVKRERFLELDALRGIAAFAVVLFHYTTRYDQIYSHATPLNFSLPLGYYGVQLFFLISGFVIFLTLEKAQGALDFAASRFSRLYPAYWSAVALTFGVLCLAPLPGRAVTVSSAIVNLTMLQEWFGLPHVDGVYWTLTVELTFYALMLAVFQAGLLKRIVPVSAVWLVVAAIAQVDSVKGYVPGLVRNLLILNYAAFFIGGICFYLLRTKGPDKSRTLLLLGCVSVAALSNKIENVWIVWMFFGIFYAFSRNWIAFLAIPPLVFLGTISYSLYLIHQNLGYVVMRSIEAHGISANLSVLCALITSVGVATVITFLVERPSMRAIRTWYNVKYKAKFALRPILGGGVEPGNEALLK